MGSMSDYDLMLQEVSQIVGDPVLSAEEQIERRMDSVLRELDEFVALAANAETVDLIERNSLLMGQIASRAGLAASFLIAKQPLRLVGR